VEHKIGIINPGQMGVFIAASAIRSGNAVYWASEGRGKKTRERAEEHGLTEVGLLRELCDSCEIILSVCPPHAAEDVADSVVAQSFQGTYVEANAISPMRSRGIGERISTAGVHFVDGGIVGNPAWESGETWLYLAGEGADEVAGCFQTESLRTCVLGNTIGKASALKMCYASYTKGSTALTTAILGTAESLGVREKLEEQWARDWPGFDEKARMRARRVTAKAWRFEGEMREISATFSDAGLPGEFHKAAEEIFRRLSHFKDAPSTPSLKEVFDALIQPKDG
jgi:3-hydroxyisobutyrate dehydrogenase-like beta-hydroxyacid dehydrogenase